MTDFLQAESAIRQLYARYCDAVWRKDIEAFQQCFTEDAVWKIAGRTLRGRAEIGAGLESFLAQSERVMIFVGLPVLEVDNGTALGRVQLTELVKLKDGGAVRTLGVYYERFHESHEGWRIRHHHFDLYYYGPPDVSAPLFDCIEYGPPPGMPGPDAPTTTRKN